MQPVWLPGFGLKVIRPIHLRNVVWKLRELPVQELTHMQALTYLLTEEVSEEL